MTVLVDTGVLYADHDVDATRHEAARTALEAVYDGELGLPYVSDYIYDEAITLTLQRAGSVDAAIRIGNRLRGVDPFPQTYELLYVSPAVFIDAIEAFEQDDDQALSFTDATTVSPMQRHGIDHVLTFDDDFEGIVSRLNPESF